MKFLEKRASAGAGKECDSPRLCVNPLLFNQSFDFSREALHKKRAACLLRETDSGFFQISLELKAKASGLEFNVFVDRDRHTNK